MSSMTRRALLRTTAMIPVAVLITQCTGTSTTLAQVIADINTLATGVKAILPTIQSLTGIKNTVVDGVTAGINALEGAAAAIGNATAGGAQSIATNVEAAIGGITSALSGVSLPATLSKILAAAQTIVPVIMQGVGLASKIFGPAAGAPMSAADARAVLWAAPAVLRTS